jgi:hypothetical protein
MNSKQRRQSKRAKYFWHLNRINDPAYSIAGVAWCPHFTYEHDHDIDLYFVNKKTKRVYFCVMSTIILAYLVDVEDQVLNIDYQDSEDIEKLYNDRTREIMNCGSVTVREEVWPLKCRKNVTGLEVKLAVEYFSTADVPRLIEWLLEHDCRPYSGPDVFSFTAEQIKDATETDHGFGTIYNQIDIKNKSKILGR